MRTWRKEDSSLMVGVLPFSDEDVQEQQYWDFMTQQLGEMHVTHLLSRRRFCGGKRPLSCYAFLFDAAFPPDKLRADRLVDFCLIATSPPQQLLADSNHSS
jgi:hypothetical protein